MVDLPRIGTSPSTPAPSAPAPTPEPSAPAADAEFSYNAQDVYVMPSKPTVVKNVSGGSTPSTERVKLNGQLAPENGKYVFADGDKARNTAAVSFSAAAKTVEVFEKAFGQTIPWAFNGPRLSVTPNEGENFNAYYSRWSGGVHFFAGTDNVIGDAIMSGGSGEVVAHEVGHAMLDGLRPNYLSGWSPDPGGFHESFGDMVGMLMAFQDERSVNRAAVQTGGDLKKPNVLAATGESLGIGINDFKGNQRTGGDWVRNAINTFTWVDPSTLPDSAPSDQLSREVHSFSRLWTGAFYDVLCGIQAENMAKGMNAKDALKATGDEGLKQLANMMKLAPKGDFAYRDMANAWIQADKQFNGGARADLIRSVMEKRLILSPDATPAQPVTPTTVETSILKSVDEGQTRTLTLKLSGKQYGMFDGAKVETVIDKDGGLMKDAEAASRTRENVERLIKAGQIRYNDPGYPMKPADYFNPHGQPYIGVVRWDNGEMVIERSKVTT